MKKILYSVLLVSMTFCFMTIQSCKEDTTPPKITIIGEKEVVIAKGATYADAGATADDNKDESVYVISDFSSTNPDMNVTGEYTITYTAQDRNANIAKAERKVFVTWTGVQLSFTYVVTDTCLNDTLLNTSYSSAASPIFLSPFRVNVSNFMNFFSGDTYLDVKELQRTYLT